jgi:Ni/Co efflux regulator RcnB
MMGFTDDGQADDALIHDRDRRLGVSTPRKRRNRADILSPEVVPGANAWERGRTVQMRLEEMDFRR